MITPVRRVLRTAVAVVLLIGTGLVVRHNVRIYLAHQRAAAEAARAEERRAAMRGHRQTMFERLQPVALANCKLERFGEANDGGYLMCGNLLEGVEVAYSYGISGYDKWGCDISTRFKVRLHQYDCFDTTRPACPSGRPIFHAECIDAITTRENRRRFDTIAGQFARNGDRGKRVALKIDVEGAEWDSFLSAPVAVLQQIDQMAVEFHRVEDEKYLRAIDRLRQFFHVVHIHFNNFSCEDGIEPFPAWAYEVLFVNKRLGVVDESRKAGGLHPLDTPNHPGIDDCQP